MTEAINTRNDADEQSLKVSDGVIKAVVADKNFGDDSARNEAMGFVRKSERKSGLTRKSTTPPAKPNP